MPDFGPGWGSAGRNGNDATNPGGGGNAPWPNNQPTTPVNTAGVNGSGGGGGICSVNNEGAVSCTDGGNGGAGVVEITYTTKAPGIGGSGGGAGGLAHIVNFEIQPGTAVKIQAGKRGKGGGSGADGNDGGESYVEINGKKYSVSGGTGGKAGTAGIPPSDNISSPTMPKAGNAGIGGKSDIDKTVKFDGEKGDTGTAGLNGNVSLASGGNGGINPKISMFADIPCGGLSTTAISGVACNRSSNMPALLMRTLTKDDFNSAFKSTYAAGATGGGGGGWNGNLSSGIKASSGADGLGGYVFVYFGPW